MPVLLLALIVVPIAEIAVFIEVGRWVGLWPTLLGIVLSAVIGAALLRRQGLKTVRDAQAALRRDELPVRQLFDGLCLFLAGAFLLTPGFITDTVGFLLLVPPVRAAIGRRLWEALRRRGRVTVTTPGRRPGRAAGAEVIDAEYRELDDEADAREPDDAVDLPPLRGSRWGHRRDR